MNNRLLYKKTDLNLLYHLKNIPILLWTKTILKKLNLFIRNPDIRFITL